MVSTSQNHFHQRHFSCYTKSLSTQKHEMAGKNEGNKNEIFPFQWFWVAFFSYYIQEIISTAVSRCCLVFGELKCTQYSANIRKYRHFLMVNNANHHEYEWNIKSKTFKISYSEIVNSLHLRFHNFAIKKL